MRIENFRRSVAGGAARTEATVVWEDAARPSSTLFFEVARGDPSGVGLETNAFLAGCAIPASRGGERRIAIDGEACPELAGGIGRALAVLRSWYSDAGSTPVIEPAAGFRKPAPAKEPRAGFFLTGGVDSLYTLVRNRNEVPASDPRALREALFVEGVSFPENDEAKRNNLDARALAAVVPIAASASLTLTRIRTNLLGVHRDLDAFARRSHGSYLAASGLLLAGVLTRVTINSSQDVWNGLRPWGSHPELDPQFSTGAIAIRHEGTETTRLEKVREVARHPFALASLFVCVQGPWNGPLNCGRCEKCVRTRLEILTAAGIDSPPTFPEAPLTPETIAMTPSPPPHRRFYHWEGLEAAVRAAGRPDLADAIAGRMRQERRLVEWRDDRGWKGRLRRFDRRFLGGAMLRMRRGLGPRPSADG